MVSSRYRIARRRTFELFSARTGGAFGLYIDWFIMALIAANVVAVTLGTVDPLQARYGTFFHWFEVVSVAVFTVEYLARIWSCTSRPEYAGPLRGRVRFASRPMLVIDFLAILPFFLGAVVALDFRFLRALRLFRFFRLLKMARYSDSMLYLKRVCLKKKEDLVVAFSANLVMLLVASSVMYFLEHRRNPRRFPRSPRRSGGVS
jgi:voltage-gated potassium channel